MEIILVAGIVAFYFLNKKEMAVGEWVRQLNILLRLGIFTGIIGFILNVISSVFSNIGVVNESTLLIYNTMTTVGKTLIFLSVLCFVLYIVIFLKDLLFGKKQ
ncbi:MULTISPECIES: hypothetical protein [Streptococcus]|uniref:hypothetical protein n=1 Tax=Streptococcus TaxID=1301 RepID=UPI0022E288F4|nr:hypothetical protein [Streptococcus infantarius]